MFVVDRVDGATTPQRVLSYDGRSLVSNIEAASIVCAEIESCLRAIGVEDDFYPPVPSDVLSALERFGEFSFFAFGVKLFVHIP